MQRWFTALRVLLLIVLVLPLAGCSKLLYEIGIGAPPKQSTEGADPAAIRQAAANTTFVTTVGNTVTIGSYSYRIAPATGIDTLHAPALRPGRIIARITVTAAEAPRGSPFRGYMVGENYVWIDHSLDRWRMLIVPADARAAVTGIYATVRGDTRVPNPPARAELKVANADEDGEREEAPAPWVGCRSCCMCGEYECAELYPHPGEFIEIPQLDRPRLR